MLIFPILLSKYDDENHQNNDQLWDYDELLIVVPGAVSMKRNSLDGGDDDDDEHDHTWKFDWEGFSFYGWRIDHFLVVDDRSDTMRLDEGLEVDEIYDDDKDGGDGGGDDHQGSREDPSLYHDHHKNEVLFDYDGRSS
jgi:hypothetical protein